MAKLIYPAISSLDGYVADDTGNFDWAALDEEVHTFVNDLHQNNVEAVWHAPEPVVDGPGRPGVP